MLGLPVWEEAKGHGGSSIDRLWKQWGWHEAIADKIRKVHAEVVASGVAASSGGDAHAEIDGLAALLAAARARIARNAMSGQGEPFQKRFSRRNWWCTFRGC